MRRNKMVVMRIIFKKGLPDGRRVIVYNDGTQRNSTIVVVTTDDGKPEQIPLKDGLDWEDELVKISAVTKKDLGLE